MCIIPICVIYCHAYIVFNNFIIFILFYSWGLLVCYVADFSAVCTNELSQLVKDFHEFESRGVKILAMSCDSINSHTKWIEVIILTIINLKKYNNLYNSLYNIMFNKL
jgi:hypothetical protein